MKSDYSVSDIAAWRKAYGYTLRFRKIPTSAEVFNKGVKIGHLTNIDGVWFFFKLPSEKDIRELVRKGGRLGI